MEQNAHSAHPIIRPRQAWVTVILAVVLAGLGLGGVWSNERQGGSAVSAGVFYVEVARHMEPPELFAFSDPPMLSEVLDAAGVRPPANFTDVRLDTPVSVWLNPAGIGIAPLSGAASLALGRKMDLNAASPRELQLINGIGPATARLIASDRAENGPYHKLEDLTRIRGIGPKTVEKLRSQAVAGESSSVE